jgi:cell division protein FtsW
MVQRVRTDWPLFLSVVLLVSFGLVMVYSASSVVAEMKFSEESYFFLLRQAGAAILAFCVFMFFSKADYRALKSARWAFVSLGVVLVLLAGVYFADPRTHRWYRFGFAQFQPSEFAKPALIIFLAWFVTLRSAKINSRHTILPAAMALGALAVMVVLADLGTAVVLVATAAAVFYVAGLEKRYFLIGFALTLLFIVSAIVWKPYRLARILAYFDPEYKILDVIDPNGHVKGYVHSGAAPRDPGYQARQSKIAVGSGGVLGLGLMQGKQKLLYLPEAHTDFIYAVVAEELGLVGSLAVLGAFLIILWRGFRLYWIALDDFGRYLAIGVTASIVVQAFVNMSVVLGMAPTKGIPLPLVSYGGSSLLSSMISLGLLLSVSERAG